MAQYDGSIRINTKIDTDGLKKGESEIKGSMSRVSNSAKIIEKSMGRISSAAKKFAGIIASAFAIGKIAQFGKEMLELGSDLQEVQNVVDVTFATMSKKVDEFAKNAAVSAGLSETMAKKYVGTFGAMAKSFGFSEQAAYGMSTALAQLSGDVASFYNITQDEAYIKLKSVFTGETETLKDLGVVMTQSALDAYALANGFGKTTSAMSENEKVALRFQFVMQQLSGASGDFMRTSSGWANQVRILKLQFESLKATIGQGLINVFTPVIKMINVLLGKLATLANAFKAFTELITGNKSKSGGSVGLSKGTGEDIGAGYNAAADGAENLAAANDKAAKSAGKAAKAAKGQLSTLDKLNNLSSESSGAGGGGAGGGGAGGEIARAIEDVDYGSLAEGETKFEKLGGILDSIIAKIKELAGLFKQGFFEGIGDYKPRLEELKKDIVSIGRSLKEIFTDPGVVSAANNFAGQLAYSLGQITGSIASIGLAIAQLLVGGMEKYLVQNVDRIKKYIISMFDIGTDIASIIGNFSVAFADIFSVFGGDTAQQISGNIIGIFAEVGMMVSETALKLGRDILNMITKPIIENKDKIKTAIEGTLQAIEPFTSGLLTAIQTVRDAVADIYDNHLKPLFDSIADGLSTIMGTLLDGYNQYVAPVLQALGERFKEIMEGPFKDTIDKITNFLGKLIDSLKLLWENVLVPLFDWIAANVMPILAKVLEFVGNALLDAFETIIKVVGDIADILSGVIDFVVGVFTGDWEKAWDGIKEIFSGVWDLIKDVLSGAWKFIKNLVKNGVEFIKSVIKAGWEAVKLVTSTVWNAIKGVLTTIWNGLKALASTIFNAVKTKISTVWNGIKTVTSTVWSAIKTSVTTVWNGLKNTVSTVFGSIKTKIISIWNAVKTSTTNIWNGIKNAIKTPINAIIGFINRMISGIVTGINALTSALNKIKIDIPDGFPVIGGKSLGFNIPKISAPQIPALATGTVVPPNKEFLALLGDNKREPEVVSPLSTIEQAVENAMRRNGGTGGGEITIKIPVEIDGRVLFELVKKFDLAQYQRTGKPSFQI